MRMLIKIRTHIIVMVMMAVCLAAAAQDNDKILNRQYADMKPIHFGFSVGMALQNLAITNNGYITDDGNAWVADVPDHSPGFTVGMLADLRLNKYFNLRFTPGMQFGNKVVKFRDANNPEQTKLESQNVKSTYIVMPLDVKYSALRYHNLRPYFIGGVMGVFDISKTRSEQLKFAKSDVMLSVGFGCDFYLPYFKFCPEVKFCFGLRDILQRKRPDLEDNPTMENFTKSIGKVTNNMVVVTFYFE